MVRHRRPPRPHTVRDHDRKNTHVDSYPRGSGATKNKSGTGIVDECESCGYVKMVAQREIKEKGKTRNVKWCDLCYVNYQKDRSKGVKTKTAEEVNRNREKWNFTYSIDNARELAGKNKDIFRLPSGVYVVRKNIKSKHGYARKPSLGVYILESLYNTRRSSRAKVKALEEEGYKVRQWINPKTSNIEVYRSKIKLTKKKLKKRFRVLWNQDPKENVLISAYTKDEALDLGASRLKSTNIRAIELKDSGRKYFSDLESARKFAETKQNNSPHAKAIATSDVWRKKDISRKHKNYMVKY